ncbi:ankyrin, partial [Polyplosphaeria fusca]
AASLGRGVLINTLQRAGAVVDDIGGFMGTPLCMAAYCRDLQCVRLLLDRGADPNSRGGYFGNSLHIAAAGGCVEIAELLITHGANVAATGGAYGTGRTILHIAAAGEKVEPVQYLLELGMDANQKDPRGWTALHYACLSTNIDIMKALL